MPHSLFKSIWNVVLIILLIYTATYMPYKICFIDDPTYTSEVIDQIVDALFAIDIFVNFMSAVELADGNIAMQPKLIAQIYLRSWFLFDLVAVFPFQQIISSATIDSQGQKTGTDYNQLVRLVRLPRLYRMVRILRIIKLIKVARKNRVLTKLTRALKMKAAILRMIQGLISAVLVTHIFACFWFLCAKFEDLGPQTWVFQKGIVDHDPTW